jgi:putative phosphoesterase
MTPAKTRDGKRSVLIGILSDSHDDIRPVRAALRLLDSVGAEFLIHCGDVGGREIFAEFIGRPFAFVWGNTDEPDNGLGTFLQSVGIRPPGAIPLSLDLDGKRIHVFHGHERAFARSQALDPPDYVLHGHTHIARNERNGRTRFINPGALHRTPRKTVATLDTQTDRVVFLGIGD